MTFVTKKKFSDGAPDIYKRERIWQEINNMVAAEIDAPTFGGSSDFVADSQKLLKIHRDFS